MGREVRSECPHAKASPQICDPGARQAREGNTNGSTRDQLGARPCIQIGHAVLAREERHQSIWMRATNLRIIVAAQSGEPAMRTEDRRVVASIGGPG
jgi:hypothetical protein